MASRSGLLLLQEQWHHTEAKLCLPGCRCPSTSPVAVHAEPQGWGGWGGGGVCHNLPFRCCHHSKRGRAWRTPHGSLSCTRRD